MIPFPAPAGTPPGVFTYNTTPLAETTAPYPGECEVNYTATGNIAGVLTFGPDSELAGIYALNSLSDTDAAHTAIEQLVNLRQDAPVSGIGDEAYASATGGEVRVRNDVFDVTWETGLPPGVTVEGVLQGVVDALNS